MHKPRWLTVILLLAFVLAIGGSPGTAGSDENLNVFNRTSLVVDAHYPDASHFGFAVVNNNTMIYYIVNISANVTDATFSPSDNNFVVEPKSVKEVTIEIKPYKRVAKKNCSITFEVRNAVNLSQVQTFEFTLEITYVGVVSTEKIIGIFENFLPYPLNNVYGVFLLDIIFWSIIIVVLYYLTETIIARFVKRTKTDLDDRILAIVRKPLLVFFITYAIVSSTEVLDLPDVFYNYLYNFYWSVVILLFGYMAYRLWKDVVIHFFQKVAQKTETEIDDILVPVFDKVGGAIIVVIILIYFANKVFSVDVTLLVASMGVVGLIIGFAAQDSLSNFFSGVLLMLDRPFAEGDVVSLGDSDKWYRVERIGLRSTRFYSIFEDVIVVIPNNKLSSERIVNIVEPENTIRCRVEFSVSYGSDPKKVLKVAEEVALAHPDVIKNKDNAPVVRFRNFGESSLNFAIFFVVREYSQKYRVESEIRTNLFERLRKEGIEIPFPQLDVHIKSWKGGG